MRMIDPLITELEQEAITTRRLLERVPADKLNWRPHPKSRTLGQLAMHVATVPGAVSEIGMMKSFEFENAPGDADPKSVKEILSAHDASIAQAKRNFVSLDDARAMEPWTGMMGGKPVFTAPRIGLMRMIALNHWYHHRGQLSAFVRELNVPVPSIYGPSADENPFLAAAEAAGAMKA